MIVDGRAVNLPGTVEESEEHPEADGSGAREDGELAGEADLRGVVEAPLEEVDLVVRGGAAERGPLGHPHPADAAVGVSAGQGDPRAELLVANIRQTPPVRAFDDVAGAFEDQRGH